MVWDGRRDDWGRVAARMVGRAGVRIEIPLMFREERGSDVYLPMSRMALRRVGIKLRELADEIDRATAYGVDGGNKPLYQIGAALVQIKACASSVNSQIGAIAKAEHAAATQEIGTIGKGQSYQRHTVNGPETVDTVDTDHTQDTVLKVVR